MILAKISEGLIGNEGAIYPCPKGQGVIAKSWVLNDKKANLFMTFIDCHIKQFKCKAMSDNRNLSSFNVDYSTLKEKYSMDVLKELLLNVTQYVNIDTEIFLVKINPYFKLIDAIKCTPWQWYYDKNTSAESIENIYERLTNLKTPFGDDRFKALPIHADCYRKGNNRSEWLMSEQGAINTYYDEKKDSVYQYRDENCYNSIFIDAKIGIVLFFKDKPSITISFNFDSNKNLYIHQIQSQIKDRGHYKIKGDWKLACVNYLKELFPDYKLHLISGYDISKIIFDMYQNDKIPECMKVNSNTISRIKDNYDQLMSNYSNLIEKGDITYRQLFI